MGFLTICSAHEGRKPVENADLAQAREPGPHEIQLQRIGNLRLKNPHGSRKWNGSIKQFAS